MCKIALALSFNSMNLTSSCGSQRSSDFSPLYYDIVDLFEHKLIDMTNTSEGIQNQYKEVGLNKTPNKSFFILEQNSI